MTPEQLAARVLADCKRYAHNGTYGVMDEMKDGNWLHQDDALAAIARHLAPGDDLVERATTAMERLEKADPFQFPYSAADAEIDAANTITALLARISALTATVEKLTLDRDNISDKLELERALTDGAHRRARASDAKVTAIEAERVKDHAEINLKADFIDKTLNQLAAAEAEAATLRDRLARMEGEIAAEARRYAEFYPQGSDGQNTFVMFAEWVETRAALTDGGSNG